MYAQGYSIIPKYHHSIHHTLGFLVHLESIRLATNFHQSSQHWREANAARPRNCVCRTTHTFGGCNLGRTLAASLAALQHDVHKIRGPTANDSVRRLAFNLLFGIIVHK